MSSDGHITVWQRVALRMRIKVPAPPTYVLLQKFEAESDSANTGIRLLSTIAARKAVSINYNSVYYSLSENTIYFQVYF